MIQQTSLEAFSGSERSLKRHEVLKALKGLVFGSDKELATRLGWPINCVTPRRGELVRVGLVERVGFAWDNGRRCIVWGTK